MGFRHSAVVLGVLSSCWGCAASGERPVADGRFVAPPTQTTSTAIAPGQSDLPGKYGAVRPRLSRVISLGDVDFLDSEAPLYASTQSEPTPTVVVINNNVTQTTYIPSSRLPIHRFGPRRAWSSSTHHQPRNHPQSRRDHHEPHPHHTETEHSDGEGLGRGNAPAHRSAPSPSAVPTPPVGGNWPGLGDRSTRGAA